MNNKPQHQPKNAAVRGAPDLKPLPESATAFIAQATGAGGATTAPAPSVSTEAGNTSRVAAPSVDVVDDASSFPWEGLDDRRRSPAHQLRMSDYERAVLDFVCDADRLPSKHDAVMTVLRGWLGDRVKALTGESITFSADAKKRRG